MKEIIPVKRILFLFAFLAVMVSIQTAVAQDTDTPIPEPQSLETPADREVIIVADPTGKPPPPVPAPAIVMNPNAVQATTILVNYVDKASTWDTQPGAETAFQYAVDIWESLIYSPVPITIDAYWMPLGPNVLGSAGALDYKYDHPSFPYNHTYYPIALANSITGFDYNLNEADIRARFSSNFSWYFGTDFNTPPNQYNFVTVVLHEIGHGLGFVGSMRWDNATYNPANNDFIECRGIYNESCWGFTDGGVLRPFIYDRFTKNGSGTPLLNTSVFPNPSVQLRQQLTSNNIIFDGANAKDKNGGAVPLYAPSLWDSGSTYSHLGENFNSTENALMTYSLAPGETNYHPGPVALGLLKDMGWQVFFPAELAPLPTQLLEVDTEVTHAIDLVDYTIRESDIWFDYIISYDMTDYGNPQAGITFDGRFVSLNPEAGWTGKTTATAQVTDQSNDPSNSTFTVVVAEEIKRVYLPAISKQ